jgi:fructokinase
MAATSQTTRIGAIEAGGTKFVCAVGSGTTGRLAARVELPTGDDPGRCLAEVGRWLGERQLELGRLQAIGVASFGPIDLDPASRAYGRITTTPKPGWANADLLGPLRQALGDLPVGFDTDVNGAALGERTWGAAQGLDDFVYVTMGTGIGGGGMARGRLLHGLVHPEMGHLRLARAAGDNFPGACPYHGDCWEGLCSGPAISARAGAPAEELPADHEAWRLAAHYTAVALANIVCTLSPRRIIVGGSVRKGGKLGEARFFEMVRSRLTATLKGYVVSPALSDAGIDQYIVPPQLGDDAGVLGAVALGQRALENVPP